jgi:hypothetical protein
VGALSRGSFPLARFEKSLTLAGGVVDRGRRFDVEQK